MHQPGGAVQLGGIQEGVAGVVERLGPAAADFVEMDELELERFLVGSLNGSGDNRRVLHFADLEAGRRRRMVRRRPVRFEAF